MPETYRLAANSSLAGVELGEVTGLAASDSGVFALDPLTPQLLRLTPELDGLRWVSAREGKGPGELVVRRISNPFNRRINHATLADSIVTVLNDGRAHQFNTEGDFLSYVGEQGIRGTPARIAASKRGLLYDRLGHDPLSGSFDIQAPVFQILTFPENRPLFELPLKPLPILNGAPFVGPGQALPLWASNGKCLVVSDGSTDSLWVVDLENNQTAVLNIATESAMQVRAPDISPAPDARGVVLEEPDPSQLKRYDGLVISPAGAVWLRPFQSAQREGSIVLIGRAANRHFQIDTVPHFPLAFGRGMSFYALHRTRLGTESILLYSPEDSGAGSR